MIRSIVAGLAAAALLLTTSVSLAQEILGTTFHQLSYNLDQGNVLVPYSDWGEVRLEYMGESEIVYLNVFVENVGWVIQNVPVLSNQGYGVPQVNGVSFGLGNSVGIPVTSINYGIQLTTDTLIVPPIVDFFDVPVSEELIAFGSDTPGGKLPAPAKGKPAIGGKVVKPLLHVNKGIENPHQGKNECAPYAYLNSLKWMKKIHKLKIPDEKLSIDHMKDVVNYVTGPPPGTPVGHAALKAKEYEEWVITEVIKANGDVDRIGKLLDHNCDIELRLRYAGQEDGHVVVVTGWAKLENGNYKMDVQHDREQGEGGEGKGEVTDHFDWDKKAETVCLAGESYVVDYFVCECPRKKGK